MEEKKLEDIYRLAMKVMIMALVGGLSILAGITWSVKVTAEESGKKTPRVVYPAKSKLEFEGTQIEGELRNPGEFYFQHRPEGKMDSLVQRRKNFHREMLRDVVLSK